MMLNDLKIQINGFEENDSDTLTQEITSQLEHFTNLDLRRLERIIITQNFESEIETLTSQADAVFKNRYLSRKKTLAKVLTLPKKEDFTFVMILRSSYARNFLSYHDNVMSHDDAVHVFHHELAHVHDNNNKIDQFKETMKISTYKGKDALLFPIAEVCWSEYIANFISSQSAQNSFMPEILANSLEIAIKEKEQNIKTMVNVFRSNRLRADLLHAIKDEVESLLKTAAYIIGYMHGMNKTLEELSYDSNYYLECSYFKDIWDVLLYELSSMLQVYPDGWINPSIYQNLAFAIEAFFNQMGVVIMQTDENEVYFKVM